MVTKSPLETAMSAVVVAGLSIVTMLVYYGFDPLVVLVDPDTVLAVSFVSVLLLSWFLLSVLDTDRIEYLVIWVVVPMTAVTVTRVVFYPEWGAGPYNVHAHPFVVSAAGLLGVGMERAASRIISNHRDRLEPLIKYRAVLMLLILIGPAAFFGMTYFSTPDVTITSTDPGFACGDVEAYDDRLADGNNCPIGLIHTVAIGLEPDGNAIRLVMETPSGVEIDRWFSPDEMDRESVTIFLSAHAHITAPPEKGTYTVYVESIRGDRIDETTFEISQLSSASVTDVAVVGTDPTMVDITIAYEGDFVIELDPIAMHFSDVRLDFHDPLTFDGTGTETVRATIVDREGEPRTLEPGTYTMDILFERVDGRVIYDFDVPDE